MTSATIRTPDTLAVTTATFLPKIPSEAPPPAPGSPSHGVVRHLRRLIATVVGLCVIMALPGTALAYTEPIGPDSGTVPNVGPNAYQGSASHSSASGWGLMTLVGVIVISIFAVGLVVIGLRVARHRRDAHPTALSA